MKICFQCQKPKQLSDFNKNKRKKDGLNTACRECQKIASRKYYTGNREKHKKATMARNMLQRERNRKYVFKFLMKNPCIDCGEADPRCLEFDHKHSKCGHISTMIGRGNSIRTIQSEIEKCDVRCANCHNKKTAKERNYFTQRFLDELKER